MSKATMHSTASGAVRHSFQLALRSVAFTALGAALALTGCTYPTETEPGTTAASTSETMTTSSEPPSTVAPPSTTPEITPPETATPEVTTPPAEAWVTAYYMVDTRAGLRLVRERQAVPDATVSTAVAAMIAGPVDPDYTTPWNPETEVLSASASDGRVTVDLSQDALTASIGSEGAALMIQQLAWTATEAAGQPDAEVILLVEGAAPGDLWGVMRWDEPVVRADPMDVRTFVQLDVPAEGEAFPSGTVTISGEAAAFEANVPWRITADGTEVESGFTMTSAGQEFAPFQFTVQLEPGEYVVEITEDDPSDGEGGPAMSDTRTFTVTE